VYYSPRSATERKRIMELIKPNEKILIMFSGCGPFICVLSKNTKAKYVVGIELNKEGHKLALENIKENKLKKADSICGDVRAICPQLKEENVFFDRIIMPLPKTAEEFLPETFLISKKGTTIHLYDFVEEKDFPKKTINTIDKYCKQAKLEYEILNSVKCGQFSPSIYRICVDFKIL
jgi:tRNA (guanine37-N1)-methyltransferase